MLRHAPETIYLDMDENGWIEVDQLINNAKKYSNLYLTFEIIENIINTNDKQRFTFNSTKRKIRANQGHSISIDLQLESRVPPDILFHGTTKRFLDSILEKGLKSMSHQHVHLSENEKTAINVGKRRGQPVVLIIDGKKMYEKGYEFFLSKNKVWLVNHVPPEFIDI
ncbi:RNA 2'-phosphotransferase [Methanobrevibacter filiformis]|uniref:Probable RNA 2'-phosphotransferase n=1 Tax=Methanobrevibacter filiformis TaxID=55758 RepID=A0A166EW28_9EURY|nr:RNA 2'-phosphotransferase [Methanobrevibacter filiformis]